MLVLSEFQSDSEYSKREKRIDAMQKFASKSRNFKGDTKKISQIIEELSYTAGQRRFTTNMIREKFYSYFYDRY